MSNSVSNKKTVLITGCTSGLGLATAQFLANDGYIVYAGVRTKEQAIKYNHDFSHLSSLHFIELNLLNNNSILQATENLKSKSINVDILINNAGILILGPPDALTTEEMSTIFQVNVLGLNYLTQLILPMMRAQNSGHLVFISSTCGIESSSFTGAYAATKFALEAIAESWATVLFKWNIKVSIVEPGAVSTNLISAQRSGSFYHDKDPYANLIQHSTEFLSEIISKGEPPEKIAQLIADIISSENPLLRYQTCSYSKDVVSKHLVDPQGEWITEHQKLIKDWF